MPLAEIFEAIDDGTITEKCGKRCRGVCLPQLQNHMSRNMRSSSSFNSTLTVCLHCHPGFTCVQDKDILDEVLTNLINEFTVVGYFGLPWFSNWALFMVDWHHHGVA
jgi:hypothetical protein